MVVLLLKENITGGEIGKVFGHSWIIPIDFCVQAYLVLLCFTLSCLADTVLFTN